MRLWLSIAVAIVAIAFLNTGCNTKKTDDGGAQASPTDPKQKGGGKAGAPRPAD